jgi:hypothetical protein
MVGFSKVGVKIYFDRHRWKRRRAGMDARTRFSTRIVDGLPIVAAYLSEVAIGQIVDDAVPWDGEVPLGTLVEIFIVNRLLEPKALYGIGPWAEKASVTEYYG